jgi:hypothetical protein
VLRRILGLKRDEVVRDWRRLRNEELHNLYTSQNITTVVKSRRVRLADHVVHKGKMKNACNIVAGKPEWKRPLGRRRHRWKIILKLILRK